MSDRATCWSVTINNPTESDKDNVGLAKQRAGWKVDGQEEQGENGTVHYQMIVKTPQTRFSTIKKAFPRAHIEIARDPKALEKYVHKSDTKIGELPNDDRFPTSVTKLWELFAIEIDEFYPKGQYVDWDGDEFLIQFDKVIGYLILKGYHVESFGVNPQIRSSIKKFGYQILMRTQEYIRRQKTDRQTELISDIDSIIDGTEEASSESESESEGSTSSSSTWEES
jgi:hypothetical protein